MGTPLDEPPPIPPATDDGRELRGPVEPFIQHLPLLPPLPHQKVVDMSPSPPSKKPFSLPYLPTEILQEILIYLSPHDFDSARLACRDWFQASSCRALLQHNVDVLHAYPGASTSSQWNNLQTFSVPQLRRYFTTLITEWPGSRHRVPCLKTRLDTRALLDFANIKSTNTTTPLPLSSSPSGAAESFECVGFSRQTGSFAALVAGRRPNRKLYICRIFSKTHRTLESRPHRYSCCPCVPEPGPLYMVFDMKTALDLRIVKVEMEELENPSSVKELSITFETGIVETYTFQGLAPHRIYQLNIRDKTVRTAAAAHLHNHAHTHNHTANCNHGPYRAYTQSSSLAGRTARHHHHTSSRTPTQHTGGKKLLGMLQGFFHVLSMSPRGSLEVKTAMPPSEPRMMRVRLFDDEEVCHVLSLPFDGQENNVGVLAISQRTNTIYVCGTSAFPSAPPLQPQAAHVPRKGGIREDATATVYMHHWLRVPPRTAKGGEIAHVSVAPLMHYDIGQQLSYMGVLVGYSSGEIWLWRMSRAWRHLAPGGTLEDSREKLPSGTYRPEQTPCISTAIPPLDGPGMTKEAMSALPLLHIVPPEECQTAANLEEPNSKAWKLAYLPGLKALNFVARGVVILAADGKFVWGFDMREQFGVDRNTVYAPWAGAGMFGGVWGDGGEVSVS
ncbi:hypothetical protein DRE_00752 [Drechslerella stenobrocha 248]|uniref:F-box domain-containing protein n=1 Tax=Drechslerella stenobrocha 248 TaxID=1043628 RepID=W7HZI4_9PEZI|nr:hypothetical protein DRE_00752 [Drechslerella stenobrocha 248]